MNPTRFCCSAQLARTLLLTACFTGTFVAATSAESGSSAGKPALPKIEKQFIVFPESVVLEQWPHTLKLVNAPQDLKLLNPGQCVRLGILATGDNRDSFLEQSQIAFRAEFAGQKQDYPMAQLAATKQIKPEGGDFVTQALAAANIDNPLKTVASMGASSANWCVPADARDGTVTIDADVESPSGHEKLEQMTIPVESFDTGSKRAFADADEFEKFSMGFHYQPNPARLYPAMQFFVAKVASREHPESFMDFAAMAGAALKANPEAAKDFTARLTSENNLSVKGVGLIVLKIGGYDIEPVLKPMSDDAKKAFGDSEFPDPYDFSLPEDVAMRFDMLWGMFTTAGQFAPIQKISSALAWRSDWEDFDKARKSANPPHEWTPAIGRAVAYGAAGWSLSSFQQTDPLAADYIEELIALPDTPEVVKSELKVLQTDPAFRREEKK